MKNVGLLEDEIIYEKLDDLIINSNEKFLNFSDLDIE